MTTYIIRELQNLGSVREGYSVECKSLAQAKRMATRSQVYRGTELRIEDQNRNVLSWKGQNSNGEWVDQ